MSAICQSCNKVKAELHVKKSSLISGMNLLMCKTCIASKFEPRFVIILYGRQNGWDSVSPFLVPRQRYVGEPIAASDLIKS